MLMMLGPKAKDLVGSIMESYSNGEKQMTTAPREYSEECKMAAGELLKAIESKDLNRIISAFIAMSMEAEKYEPEDEED